VQKIGTVTTPEFKKLVDKVGGREAAAEAMGVTVATVANALKDEPERFLGLRPILELQRAAGVLSPVEEPEPGNGAGATIFMSADALEAIEPIRFSEKEEGFQRDMNLNQVAEIETLIRSGFTKFPPIVVGRIPGGPLLLIDGQHRRQAHMNAEIGCHAHVYEVKNLDEARLMYLVWNGRSRRPTSHEAYAASRNPVAETLKKTAEDYALTFEQVSALFRGLAGNGVDFVEPTARIKRDVIEKAERILDVWTRDSRWGNEKSALFNSSRVLRALGHFARPFALENLERALVLLRGKRNGFQKDATWDRALRRGARALATKFLTYVAPRLTVAEVEAR